MTYLAAQAGKRLGLPSRESIGNDLQEEADMSAVATLAVGLYLEAVKQQSPGSRSAHLVNGAHPSLFTTKRLYKAENHQCRNLSRKSTASRVLNQEPRPVVSERSILENVHAY